MSSTLTFRRWTGKSQLTEDEERRKNWRSDVHSSDREERSTKDASSRSKNCGDTKAGIEIQEHSAVRLEGVPQTFNYNELSEATKGFCEESIVGHGGFGVVHRGQFKKAGNQVAIKRMNLEATHRQGKREFKSEVQIISQVRHRNLIKLRGYCADGDRKEYMLVYDMMPNGNLDDALFTGSTFLSWAQKFKILTGAADGLSYLHQGLDEQVIHRDIKCSNILLDRDWNALLGDFGIARLVAHQGRAATTDMAGTVDYMAPEVFSENQFTDKADVYAFGVVVLEVACGRRVFPSPDHKMGLVQWVSFAHSKGNLLSTVDERHRDDDLKQIRRVLQVGMLCTQQNHRDRPSMRSVVQMLAGDVKVPSVSIPKTTSLLSSLKNLFQMVSSRLVSRSPTIMDRDESHRVINDSHSLTDGLDGVISESPCRSNSKLFYSGLVSRSRQNVNFDSPSTSSASGSHGAINESPSGSSSKLIFPGFMPRSRQIVNLESPSTSSASGMVNESPCDSNSKSVSPGLESRCRHTGNVESPATSSASGTAANPGLWMDLNANNSGLRILDVVNSNSGLRMDLNANNSGLRIQDVVNLGTGQMSSGRWPT